MIFPLQCNDKSPGALKLPLSEPADIFGSPATGCVFDNRHAIPICKDRLGQSTAKPSVTLVLLGFELLLYCT